MIRVLIAEDSPTVRQFLVAVLGADPDVQVVGEARDGLEAVALAQRLRPDVVVMDIQMPRMNGFEATRRLMIEQPMPIVIVSSAVDVREVSVAMQAIVAGAVTVLPKPTGSATAGFEEALPQFVSTIKAMAGIKVVRRFERTDKQPSLPDKPPIVAPRIVALAASTGGPAALARVLFGLPEDFALPLLAVQHISPGFLPGFAEWLHATTGVPTRIACHREPLQPRTLYLAPDGRHLGLHDRASVALAETPPVGGFRPSASHLFSSVADVCGAAMQAIILTGMGSDGVDGLRRVHAAGGRVWAQDEASSVVFGMPGAAVAAGLVDAVLSLEAIAFRLRLLCCEEVSP